MPVRGHTLIALGAVAAAAACASPGLDYQARIPAGDPVVSQYRAVAVDLFRGPEGGWYASAFESMLASARFDGQPWFTLVTSYDRPEGVYRGRTAISWLDERHERNIVRRCVEWDGLFDCETRADVVEHCVNYEVEVEAEPELIDLATGRPVWAARYSGRASDRVCEDLGRVEDVGERGPRHGETRRHAWHSYGFGGDVWGGYIVDELVREALSDTLSAVRADVAPQNITARARLITEAIDPEVRADPRFGFAVRAARDGQYQAACEIWSALALEYPDAPAVKFNLGACAEAAGDYARAQALYGEVSQMPVTLPEWALDALSQINRRRAGETEIDRLLGERPGS